MHYIIGTSFKINPAAKSTIRDRRLSPGNVYTLVYIAKKNNSYVYTFMDLQRQKIDIEFSSCREADGVISKIRNERIPDYDSLVQPVLDNIPD